MSIRSYKPTTPSRRHMTNSTFSEITTATPEKSLLVSIKKTGGRNNTGMITCRHIGGGNKRKYRIVDFKRNKDEVVGKIATIEYDPNRNANICLVHYADGEKRYILAPQGIAVGDTIVSGASVDIKTGNAMEIRNIPEGTFIHNVELLPGKGGQMCRAAGTSAQILGYEGKYVTLRLASGEVRKVLGTCRGDDRHRRKRRLEPGQFRQSGQKSLVRRSSDRTRFGHESERSPARRRRRKMSGRPRCAAYALGQTRAGCQDERHQESLE